MAKAVKGRPLKVYWAEIDGLNEWIVAAPNRPEALKALGVHQDLFAQGEAGDASDPDALAAGRAAPCTPLRRPKGSSAPFAPAGGFTDWSAAIPKAAPGAALKKGRRQTKAEAPPEPAKPKPDPRPLERARVRLAEIEDRHRQALEALAAERARLDERQAKEQQAYDRQEAEARRAVEAEERRYREAGGA